jgi:hypothetical protein
MFCRNCGAQTDDAAQFCIRCGVNLQEEESAPGGFPPPPPPFSQQSEAPPPPGATPYTPPEGSGWSTPTSSSGSMNMIALVWGILAFIGMGIALVPCLGSLNWLNIPFSIVGLIISVMAYQKAPMDARGSSLAGMILCGIAIAFGFIRLLLGGGIL